ncbi:MAG: 4Fe-4S dicluster domain-containing protein [Deltaproteobacteria bacterium]|nr:4Fe-4S dicluster domain-containing protein [Deltaproteobacteria bacterium]
MNETATREILWNVNSLGNVIGLYGLLAVAVFIGAVGIWRHAELWASGTEQPDLKTGWLVRIEEMFRWGLLQRGVVRERTAALAHTLIYIGFLVLLFTTTMVFIDHDLGVRIYRGQFYLAVTLASDLFGAGLLVGCIIAAHRRYIRRSDKLHNRAADSSMLIVLSLLIVQGFLLEGLRIHVTHDPWAKYSPVGLLVAKFFWGFSGESARLLHFVTWWFHTITVLAVIAIAPYTKFFHIISSSANLYFRPRKRPAGQLESVGDLEKRMESGEEFNIGLGTIKDYSWKKLLDLDACTSCGRCQDACPAYRSGKPLSPKWMILDTRNHALALSAQQKLAPSILPKPLLKMDEVLTLDFFLKRSGVEPSGEGFTSKGPFRASNPLVQEAAGVFGVSADQRISTEVMSEQVFWSCTTCMACVEACPVGINHVDMIVGNRRNMVLMQGEVPSEAQATLRALENRGNPYGAPQDRMKWADGLNVPVLKAGDSVDYLYWVGCVSAYDPRKQKIARALVTIMNKAGLSFGVLGTEESCTGDPARRLGEENLYQTLAKKNIELLKTIRFKSLVANCPHCFNTIKNEYPEFGNLGNGQSPEIIHHSTLLRRLEKEKKLSLKEGEETFTFHDPCYLGRYNDEYEAPRQSLTAAKGLKIIEMEASRNKGLCCGAGGGHFWMDLKIGERVNAIRTDQAAKTGADNVATACPFCMQMMEDGVKITGREDSLRVKDIAEVIAERLQ